MRTRAAMLRGTPGPAELVATAVTVTVLGLALVLIAPALRVPRYVDRIVVENPHPWPASVEISRPGGGWLAVGSIDPGDERTFTSVIDQGDVWELRFAYGGYAADRRVSRAQLAADGWHVTVPEELARQLGQAGMPAAPP